MKTNLNIIPNSEHLCTYVERSYVEENWLNASKPTQRKKLKIAEVTIIYIIDSQNLFKPRHDLYFEYMLKSPRYLCNIKIIIDVEVPVDS